MTIGYSRQVLLASLALVMIALTPQSSSHADEIAVINKFDEVKIKDFDTPQQLEIAQIAATANIPVESAPAVASSGGDIETIVRQAARKYGIDENNFVRIAQCESTLDPTRVNNSYYENGHPSGLFQHISGYWPARAANYGLSGASVFNAQANAEVTAGMFRDGQQGLWECR